MPRATDTRTTEQLIKQHYQDLLAEHRRTGDEVYRERAEFIAKADFEKVRWTDRESRDGVYSMATSELRRRLVPERRLDFVE
jgi:hypothetical protein